MTDTYDDGPLGAADCARCKRRVYFAWDAGMERVALEPDPGGPVAVELDRNRLPWCRDARGTQLALGERLYRLHDPACPALATVTPISRAPSRRAHLRPAGARARRLG